MSVFLFVATITVVAFEFITRHPHRVRRILYRAVNADPIFAVFLVLTGIGFASIIATHFYPPYGRLLPSLDAVLAPGIHLGIGFGILLSLFYRTFIRRSGGKDRDLTSRDWVLVAALVVTFILGSGGEQFLRDSARRLSKVSVGGAEIAFFDTTSQRRSRPEGEPSLAVGGGPAVASATAITFELYQILPGIMDRDKTYIESAWQIRKERHWKERAADSVQGLDQGKIPSLGAVEALLKTDDEWLKRDTALLQGISHAKALAKQFIEPFGACLVEIFNQTGDIDYFRKRVYGLLPPLKNLASKSYYDPPRFGQDGASAIATLYGELFVYAYDHAFAHLKVPATQPETDPIAKKAVTLGKACHTLAITFCPAANPSAKSQGTIQENPEFASCRNDDLSQPGDPSKQSALKQAESAMKKRILPVLTTFAEDKDFHTRPYVSLLTAGILTHLGHHEAGLVQLEGWLSQHKAETIGDRWLKARALQFVAYITEYWIRREGPNASIVLREFDLDRLNNALELTDELFNFKTVLRESRHKMGLTDLVSAAFSRAPPETDNCESRHLEHNETLRKGYWWYVVSYSYRAHHWLLHPDYPRRYAHLANDAITDLLQTDLSCAPPPEKIVFRAWTLYLYATMQLQDARALKGTRTKAYLDTLLEQGVRAADLGLLMTRRPAEEDRQEKLRQAAARNSSGQFLEHLAPTPAIATFEELRQVKADLVNAQQSLD